ncbi:MAG: hypothetical protein HQM08_28705 [Candidatus Riflebacteria bacterium]|nr:hypothetical protein [Candidatus Riflebacteria bacterium]
MKEFVLSGNLSYSGSIPLAAYGQLKTYKKMVFDLALEHINKFESNNPSQVSFHSRSIWYTDKESDPKGRNRVTAYMKSLAVDGVSGTF